MSDPCWAKLLELNLEKKKYWSVNFPKLNIKESISTWMVVITFNKQLVMTSRPFPQCMTPKRLLNNETCQLPFPLNL